MVALSIMVFSMFLFMVLVILSLLVIIFFFCSVVAYDLGAGSTVIGFLTIFTELFVFISMFFVFLLYFLDFALVLHIYIWFIILLYGEGGSIFDPVLLCLSQAGIRGWFQQFWLHQMETWYHTVRRRKLVVLALWQQQIHNLREVIQTQHQTCSNGG